MKCTTPQCVNFPKATTVLSCSRAGETVSTMATMHLGKLYKYRKGSGNVLGRSPMMVIAYQVSQLLNR